MLRFSLLFSGLLLWFNFSLFAQSNEFEDIKGNVKTIESVEYEVIENNGNFIKNPDEDEDPLITVTQFNRRGSVTRQEGLLNNGKLVYRYDYKYDAIGFFVGEYIYDAKKRLREKYQVIYNDKNKMKESTRYFDDNRIERASYKYDNEVNLIEENWTINDEKVSRKEYAYDAQKRLTQMLLYKFFGAKEVVIEKVSYVYNPNGLQETSLTYDSTEKLTRKNIAIYNLENQISKEISYNRKEILADSTVYRYDSKGNLIEENKYDNKGTLLLQTLISYKFDSKGNWIQKTDFYKELGYGVLAERKIEYYDD